MFDVFTSVVLVTFPSEVQNDNWLAKLRSFYSKKAMEFLHENGQISQSAYRVQCDHVIRITTIWTYRDCNAYEKYQNFMLNREKVGGQFFAKAPGYKRRGYEVWGDLDVTSPE